MADHSSDALFMARNPSTGENLSPINVTPLAEVAKRVEQARSAQAHWAETSWPSRRRLLKRWIAHLARDAEGWAEAIRQEIGKPRGEGLAELITSLDAMRWTARHGWRALKEERLGAGWQSLLLIPGACVRHRPRGVIGILGTWNYPIFLNAPAIAQALAAGNAVVWKPSELAPLMGARLQRSLVEAGLPENLVVQVQGGVEVGKALMAARIDKGMYTGGVTGGEQVLGSLGTRAIPSLAELSGMDPAIVLPDAPLEPTVKALAWGAFVGCGQTCVAVKRVFVVGYVKPWVEALGALAGRLRVGDPALGEVDMGPMISESARSRFQDQLQKAIDAGAEVVSGGNALAGPGWFHAPTVLLARSPAPEQALSGVFGPVVVVREVRSTVEAIVAANMSPFGLAASVWGRDLDSARAVGAQLEAGTVTINDAVTPIGHASAPFGGWKSSGYGRIRGIHGMREFLQTQVEQSRRPGGFRPHLFPYSARLAAMLKGYLRLYR